MKVYSILYPERRVVDEKTITTWYSDALANNELDLPHDSVSDPDEQARALDEAGLITLQCRATGG